MKSTAALEEDYRDIGTAAAMHFHCEITVDD